MDKWNFLPNSNFDIISKLLKKENEKGCDVIYSTSSYETRKKWVSEIKTNIYKYTLIHSTHKSGVRYYYSSINDKGHFGISKIIFGDSGIYNVIIDDKGLYGLTQHSIGIKINNIDEGFMIKNVLESSIFKKILNDCNWSNYQIDWRLFSYFKKDFYKEIILYNTVKKHKFINKFIKNELLIYEEFINNKL
jgi:hypothetical protein